MVPILADLQRAAREMGTKVDSWRADLSKLEAGRLPAELEMTCLNLRRLFDSALTDLELYQYFRREDGWKPVNYDGLTDGDIVEAVEEDVRLVLDTEAFAPVTDCLREGIRAMRQHEAAWRRDVARADQLAWGRPLPGEAGRIAQHLRELVSHDPIDFGHLFQYLNVCRHTSRGECARLTDRQIYATVDTDVRTVLREAELLSRQPPLAPVPPRPATTTTPPADETEGDEHPLLFKTEDGRWDLSKPGQCRYMGGKECPLARKKRKLLACLIKANRQPVSTTRLMNVCNIRGDAAALATPISRLRAHLRTHLSSVFEDDHLTYEDPEAYRLGL
jgi:hypothetical protein